MFRQVTSILISAAMSLVCGIAEPTFQFMNLDYPGGIATLAEGINPEGDIAGIYLDARSVVHGFVIRRGVFMTIDYPGAAYTEARSINPGGDIAGNYAMPGENSGVILPGPGITPINIHGFVLKRDGTWIPLAYPGHPNMIAQRILPDGSVLGCFHDHDFGYWMRGFVWSRDVYTGLDGTFEGLNVPSSMNNGATPDLGRIAGLYMDMSLGKVRGYVIRNGALVAFDYPGASSTRAWDMNSQGAIVGDYHDSTGTHGFLLKDGVFASVLFPGATVTQARGINPAGAIVGWYQDAQGGTHGFVAISQPNGR